MHGFINHKFTRTQNLAFACTFTFRMKRSFINETPGLVLLVDVVSASSSVHAVNVYLLIFILKIYFFIFFSSTNMSSKVWRNSFKRSVVILQM